MDELRQQVADLEIQETDIERQLGNAETDEEARQITNDLNLVRNRLSEKREELRIAEEKEQARAEVIEEKTHAAEIPFAVAGIDFTDLPAEVITLIEAVVKADRRRLLNEHEIELEKLDSEKSELLAANKSIADAYEELRGEHEELSGTHAEFVNAHNSVVAELRLENQDAQSKRDAAVREKEEAERQLNFANEEIRRLNDVIVDLQRAQEYNNRQTEQVTANDEEKASITAALAAVKKLYTNKEDWGSSIKVDKPDGTFELVKRKEFETEWQSVEVPSFRPEDPGANSQSNQLLLTETTASVERPAFREEEPAVQGEHVLHGTVASEAIGEVTREEFQALVKRVEALECNAVQEAA